MNFIHAHQQLTATIDQHRASHKLLLPLVALILSGGATSAAAQSYGVADRPYLGWSSFSEQTVSSNFLTQTNMQAQSDALLATGLEQHGFTYINIDAGWQGSFDSNGRPTPNTSLFADMAGLIAHIHSNGQKAGIYWTPGVPRQAVIANPQILGTAHHVNDILAVSNSAGDAFAVSDPLSSLSNFKIDFTKERRSGICQLHRRYVCFLGRRLHQTGWRSSRIFHAVHR